VTWHSVRMRPVQQHHEQQASAPWSQAPKPLILNPSVRVLWRSADAIQLELGADAVIVEGIDTELIGALAGTGLVDEQAAYRVPGLGATLQSLLAAGYLWRGPAVAPVPPSPHLAGDLAALRTRHGQAAADVLAGRAESRVVVHGGGRLAVAAATLLAAANVGHVHMHDSGDVLRHYCAPGGLLAADEGRRFNEAATDAVHRAAPGVITGPLPIGERADLTVLAMSAPIEEELRDALHAGSSAHLAAHAGADLAVVGPLVLPGLTSCLRCADLARSDRDPAWPALAVQLSTSSRYARPSDLALMSFTASVLALQALAFLDGDEPATLAGTLELLLPQWQLRRRSWPAHPECDCGAHRRLPLPSR
jgi:hypothetical protein